MLLKHALGQAIKNCRIEKNMTQRKLATRSHIAHNYLSEVERGVKYVASEVIESIASALGVQSYELVLEAGQIMANSLIPDTPEKLVEVEVKASRGEDWAKQYADLVG